MGIVAVAVGVGLWRLGWLALASALLVLGIGGHLLAWLFGRRSGGQL